MSEILTVAAAVCCPHCEEQYLELLQRREAEITRLRAQVEERDQVIAALVKGLEYYANEHNWSQVITGHHGESYGVWAGDGGENARAVLTQAEALTKGEKP